MNHSSNPPLVFKKKKSLTNAKETIKNFRLKAFAFNKNLFTEILRELF